MLRDAADRVARALRLPPMRGKVLAYGLSGLAHGPLLTIFSMYSVVVFTDVVKIHPTSFYRVHMLYGLWNAVNDPVFGWLLDKTKDEGNRRIPVLKYVAIGGGGGEEKRWGEEGVCCVRRRCVVSRCTVHVILGASEIEHIELTVRRISHLTHIRKLTHTFHFPLKVRRPAVVLRLHAPLVSVVLRRRLLGGGKTTAERGRPAEEA